MGSTPVGGGLASQIHNTMMFSRLGFPPPSNQAKGWRRLSRWTKAFCARDFNRRRSAAGFEMGGSEGASSLPGS